MPGIGKKTFQCFVMRKCMIIIINHKPWIIMNNHKDTQKIKGDRVDRSDI